MRTWRIPGVELPASALILGCWQFSGRNGWEGQVDEDSIAAVHAALDHGVNCFDTAAAYGDGFSEEMLGRALGGRRDEAVILTKPLPGTPPEELGAACDAALRRLGTDVIDLYQIHWPDRERGQAAALETLLKLKEEGKIRAIGVCNFGVADLREAIDAIGSELVSDQLPYSLLWRAIEYEVVPLCVEHRVGILCYSPLMQGLLTGKYRTPERFPDSRARTRHFPPDRPQVVHGGPGCEDETFATVDALAAIADEDGIPMADLALAWLLTRPGVRGVIAGVRDAEQTAANAAAVAREIPADVLGRCERATDDLRARLGKDPDPWRMPDNSRFR